MRQQAARPGQVPQAAGKRPPAYGNDAVSPLGALNLEDIDLDRLDKVMVLVAFLGIVVNCVQLIAISNHAWVQGTALKDGQPLTALYASSHQTLLACAFEASSSV